MTGSNDLDRMLGVYLDEGPRRAPERATDAALAFAAAHPRRRDPLLFLKPDVMARRGSLFGPQLVWAALLVALTLGAVAAIAIGSRPSHEPVVPPPSLVESPSPVPSVAPSRIAPFLRTRSTRRTFGPRWMWSPKEPAMRFSTSRSFTEETRSTFPSRMSSSRGTDSLSTT